MSIQSSNLPISLPDVKWSGQYQVQNHKNRNMSFVIRNGEYEEFGAADFRTVSTVFIKTNPFGNIFASAYI